MDVYNIDHQGFSGKWLRGVVREVVSNGVAVVVLPYDPNRDCIVMTEQFRIGALAAGRDPWVRGFVAGMMKHETEEVVANREAEEEIGCPLGRLEKIGTFMPSTGTSSEVVHVYVGEVDSSKIAEFCGLAEENEDIRVSVMPADEALDLFAKGGFIAAGSFIAMQWFASNRDRLRREWGVSA